MYFKAAGKFKFTIKKQKTKNGNPVMLEISKWKKRCFISLQIYGDIEFWDSVQERFFNIKGQRTTEAKIANEERKINNEVIERLETA